MANVTIGDLTAAPDSAAQSGDLIEVERSGASYRVTGGWLRTFVLNGLTLAWSSITGRPTTLSGYGITDAEPALGDPASDGYVLTSTAAGVRSWAAPGGGGATDHGALDGLADDDHEQYHTDARGDARYAALGHDHDSDYAALAHTHLAAGISDSTAAGRALLTAASAAAQRTALALGTAAQVNTGTGSGDVPTVSQADSRYIRAIAYQTLTDQTTIAWDVASGVSATVTLGGNRTLADPAGLSAGASYLLFVRQDGGGGRTLAYGDAYRWPGGAPPVLSTAPAAVDVLTFVSDGTYLYGAIQKAFA